jgi:hypothetical protein
MITNPPTSQIWRKKPVRKCCISLIDLLAWSNSVIICKYTRFRSLAWGGMPKFHLFSTHNKQTNKQTNKRPATWSARQVRRARRQWRRYQQANSTEDLAILCRTAFRHRDRQKDKPWEFSLVSCVASVHHLQQRRWHKTAVKLGVEPKPRNNMRMVSRKHLLLLPLLLALRNACLDLSLPASSSWSACQCHSNSPRHPENQLIMNWNHTKILIRPLFIRALSSSHFLPPIAAFYYICFI